MISMIGWQCPLVVIIFIYKLIAVFQAQDSGNETTVPKMLYIVVSESAFLLLQPEDKRKNYCTLITCATLHSLAKIERDLDVPKKITFFWRKPEKRDVIKQELYVEKANHCISFIVTQIKHLNCNVDHTVNIRCILYKNR